MENEEKLSQVSGVQCPNCGSKEVAYSAEEKKLRCPHCTHTWDLPRNNDKIIERQLGEGFQVEQMETGLGTAVKMFHCNSCGSNTAVENEKVRITCPFCGSENVNEEAMNTRTIQPAGVLPFTYPQKQALASFKTWIGEGWFRPNDLKEIAKLDKIQGVYVPFWTFDAHTESSWTADAGYYYYETESYTDENGNTQTRQVQRVRWVPASGYYEHFFDDVLVVASHGVSQSMMEGILPFKLEEVVNYDPHFIRGWECEIYQKDLKTGFGVGDKIMDSYIYQECGKRVPGDTFQNLRVSSRKSNLTFKHILLPLWIAAYTYNSKVYQFLVNGQTGKVHGDKPYSAWKIFFAILLGLIVVGIIIFVSQQNK